jgi:hypothetical protein
MKTLMSMFLVLALSVAAMATQSDNQSKPNDQSQSSASQSQPSSSQGQDTASQRQGASSQDQSSSGGSTTMSGKVSNDGKSFTNDKDSKTYHVSNPDALSGHEGQHVVILVRADPDTGVIHITQLQTPQQ